MKFGNIMMKWKRSGKMSEKRFIPSKYASHTHDVKTDKHYYVTDEYVGCRELFDEIERLEKINNKLEQKILNKGAENTKLKLTLREIVEDLEKQIKKKTPILIQQEYVDWIKGNVDLRLNSEKKKWKEDNFRW